MPHVIVLLLRLASPERGQSQKLVCSKIFKELQSWKAPRAASSITEARQKLPWQAVELLLSKARVEEPLWHGHRVFALDGSIIQVPRSKEITRDFPLRKTGEHYPRALVFCAFNVHTYQPVAARIGSIFSSEHFQLESLLEDFGEGDLFVLDRNFNSRELWTKLEARGIGFVIRLKRGALTKRLGRKKELILVYGGLRLRVVRHKKLVIVTNLLNVKIYSRKDVIELYRQRWTAETQFKRLKANMNLAKFHSKSVNGIKQEIFAGLLLLALIAGVMHQTPVPPQRQINFVAVYALLAADLPVLLIKTAAKAVLRRLRRYLKNFLTPIRPRRSYPRHSKQPENKWIKARRAKNHVLKGHWQWSNQYR